MFDSYFDIILHQYYKIQITRILSNPKIYIIQVCISPKVFNNLPSKLYMASIKHMRWIKDKT